MKLHITENANQIISGYTHVPMLYGKADLSTVPNNSADSIVAPNCINSIPYDLLGEFIESIASKMRFGCQALVGGIDLSALSTEVINGNIGSKEYNNIVYAARGIYNSVEILNTIKSLNLTINSVFMNGHNYEITFSRPTISN